jgi:site-specific DNA recombinase
LNSFSPKPSIGYPATRKIDQEDIASIFKRLRFAGVKIVTLSEGEISELHVGLKGTMNALYLKDLADKTGGVCGAASRRANRAAAIRTATTWLSRSVRELNLFAGSVRSTRHRRRSCGGSLPYAAGASPRSIAKTLNAEGVPGPSAVAWGPSTIHGNRQRGTGILKNELYIARLVWNRLRYLKDPSTGKRISRVNPESEWIVQHVPALRIIEHSL